MRDERDEQQLEQSDDADADFQQGVDAKRVVATGDEARQGEAPDAHAAHERRQQDADRDGGRADDHAEELEPDDLVDQRAETAADEQGQEEREVPSRGKRRRG